MDKENFLQCIESLKKYRRAELERDGENLIEQLYTDLLPDNYILNKSLLKNTTFLIGRKGTGKSTIFLMIEKEIQKQNDLMSCYIDVYTVYNESRMNLNELSYLKEVLPKNLLEKYLLERNFIQKILIALITQLSKNTDSFLERIKNSLIGNKKERVKELLEELLQNIEDNDVLKKIELPSIEQISYKLSQANKSEDGATGNVSVTLNPKKFISAGVEGNTKTTQEQDIEEEFSKIFVKVFQINDFIDKIKEILGIIGVKHLYILLDDFSEMENLSIRNFVNTILGPLNNNSNEFIKFKVAAYPGRFYLGAIDPGKIDLVFLDFYDLYSKFNRNQMEENSIDFTKRLLENRFKHFNNLNFEDYFDVKNNTLTDFYEKLFQVSMNVPRIVGYILSYCYESKIIYDKKIGLTDIENAAQRYYDDNISSFFSEIRISTVSINEKVTILELEKLLKEIISKLESIKEKIVKQELSGTNYDPKNPCTSHFYFSPKLESYLKTLELNFFISKYNVLSDKDGNESSIYCMNYGLVKKRNLFWGMPKNTTNQRKYFIERPFDFNNLIVDFFKKIKSIHCSNVECNKVFTEQQKNALEMYQFKCPHCGQKVIEEQISSDIFESISKINKEDCMPLPEIKILNRLKILNKKVYVRDLTEELDFSRQLIHWRSRKLDLDFKYVNRIKLKGDDVLSYEITDGGKKYLEKNTV